VGKRTEEFEVSGTRYATTHYSTGKSLRLFAKLGKIMGKPMGLIIGAGQDAEIQPEMMGDALESLFASTEPEEFEDLVKEILKGTLIFPENGSNREIVFDADFSGKIGELFQVLKHVLMFQYDFLGDLAGITPAAPAKRRTAGRIKAL